MLPMIEILMVIYLCMLSYFQEEVTPIWWSVLP